jgi:HlyD family type I secretion membrane fusion protein
MATIPISKEAESKTDLALQLSGSSDRIRRRLGWVAGVSTALVLGIATLVPIDSGAMAPGMNQVENKRKTVQHLDGGIIRAIHVRDGSVVKAGQPIIILDDTNARMNVSVFQSQSDALRAERATLEAQLLGRGQIEFPADLLRRENDPLVASILRSQRAAFAARRDEVNGKKAQLSEQITQINNEIAGESAGATARAEQIKLLDAEIADVSKLLEKGYATKPRLLALQRAAAALRGEKSGIYADSAKLRARQSEVRLVSIQTEQDSATQAANALRTLQSELAQVEEKLLAAKQVLARTQIRAPVSGVVVGMRPTTIGGVIRPSEPLMDVVPNNGNLVIAARVSPRDVDSLHVGQKAVVRFDGSGARDAPVVEGTLQKLSADALSDQRGGSYFEAEVGVPESAKRALPPELLRPGVPATVLIKTGRRTLMGYLFAPIMRARFNAIREH